MTNNDLKRLYQDNQSKELLDFARMRDVQESFVNIQASANKTVDTFIVPDITAEQLTKAYNALVAGKSCTISDKDGMNHFAVIQADMISDLPAIIIPYYWLGFVDYQETENGTVEIDVYKTQLQE